MTPKSSISAKPRLRLLVMGELRDPGAGRLLDGDTMLPYLDTIMAEKQDLPNRVKSHRLKRGWSQAELAHRAGISRTAVSAIEVNRLVPSVAAALSLANALDCSVEELFG